MTSKSSSWVPRSTQRSFLSILVCNQRRRAADFTEQESLSSSSMSCHSPLRPLSSDPHPWSDVPSWGVPAWRHSRDDEVQQCNTHMFNISHSSEFRDTNIHSLCKNSARYHPRNQDRRPAWKRGFWQGRQSRSEKEEKEAEYKESWPCYARSLQGRWVDENRSVVKLSEQLPAGQMCYL